MKQAKSRLPKKRLAKSRLPKKTNIIIKLVMAIFRTNKRATTTKPAKKARQHRQNGEFKRKITINNYNGTKDAIYL